MNYKSIKDILCLCSRVPRSADCIRWHTSTLPALKADSPPNGIRLTLKQHSLCGSRGISRPRADLFALQAVVAVALRDLRLLAGLRERAGASRLGAPRDGGRRGRIRDSSVILRQQSNPLSPRVIPPGNLPARSRKPARTETGWPPRRGAIGQPCYASAPIRSGPAGSATRPLCPRPALQA